MILSFVFASFFLNAFAVRALPALDHFSGIWSIVGMVLIMAVLIFSSRGDYQPPKAVFTTFTNKTGVSHLILPASSVSCLSHAQWPDAFAFLLGMLQSTLTTSSFDAVTHLVEEMPKPGRNAPMIMVLAPLTGGVTAWPFMVVLLFCLRNWEGVLTSALGPVLEIYHQSTNNRLGVSRGAAPSADSRQPCL